jgi:cell division initiation protein
VPIDPAALRAQQFRVVFRGYDVEEVDAFLDWIEAELGRAAAAPAVVAPVAAAPAAGDPAQCEAGVSARAARTLLHAEQTAQRVLAEAAAEAAAIRARAEVDADAILADARAEAAQLAGPVRLRPSAEVDELVARGRRLHAELDRLEESERRCREELRDWLTEHGRLLDQRPPVPAGPDARAEAAAALPRRDNPTTVRRVVTTLPMSAIR